MSSTHQQSKKRTRDESQPAAAVEPVRLCGSIDPATTNSFHERIKQQRLYEQGYMTDSLVALSQQRKKDASRFSLLLKMIPQHVVLHLLEFNQYKIAVCDDTKLNNLVGYFGGDSDRTPALIYGSIFIEEWSISSIDIRAWVAERPLFGFIMRKVKQLQFKDDFYADWIVCFPKFFDECLALRHLDMENASFSQLKVKQLFQLARSQLRTYNSMFDGDYDGKIFDLPALRRCSSRIFQHLSQDHQKNIKSIEILDMDSLDDIQRLTQSLEKLAAADNNITHLNFAYNGYDNSTHQEKSDTFGSLFRQLTKLKSLDCNGLLSMFENTFQYMPKTIENLWVNTDKSESLLQQMPMHFPNLRNLYLDISYTHQYARIIDSLNSVVDWLVSKNVTVSLTIIEQYDRSKTAEIISIVSRLNQAKLLRYLYIEYVQWSPAQLTAAGIANSALEYLCVGVAYPTTDQLVSSILSCSSLQEVKLLYIEDHRNRQFAEVLPKQLPDIKFGFGVYWNV